MYHVNTTTNAFDPLAVLMGTAVYTPEEQARYAAMGAEEAVENAERERIALLRVTSQCKKCGGTGYLSHYGHVQGGVCFRCDGSGIEGYGRA